MLNEKVCFHTRQISLQMFALLSCTIKSSVNIGIFQYLEESQVYRYSFGFKLSLIAIFCIL